VPSPTVKTPRNVSRQPRACVAWIADLVDSRRFVGRERTALQRRLLKLLDRWNNKYRHAILSRFALTIGDEFQGLLSEATIIPRLIRDLETALPEVQVWIGVGYGPLETDLQPVALGMDGRVWHLAREAIETAKAEGRLGGVFAGFGDSTGVLNGLARSLWVHYAEMTRQQRQIVDLMDEHGSQVTVAQLIGKKQPTISQTLKAVHLPAIREAEAGWQEVLTRFRETP
jgi:hypothetical protein